MKKILALVLAGALCLGLLAGCTSGKPTETDPPAPAKTDPPTTQTDEPIDIPSADYGTKLSVMLNGGSDVDVFWVKDADTIYPIANRGQMADMSSYISRDGLDLGIYNGQAEDFNIDGKQIGMPFRTDYYVLFYNKDIFDAAGVDYPSNDMTWAEFEELAKKVTMGEGVDKKYGAFFHTWQACIQNWAVQDGQHTIMDTDYSFFKPYYEMVLRMQNDDKTFLRRLRGPDAHGHLVRRHHDRQDQQG